jgi:hypothetical protein
MKQDKEALLQKSSTLFTKARKARPDRMTERMLREQGCRLVTQAEQMKKGRG